MKTRNREMERRPADAATPHRGKKLNSFLAGVATILALQALGIGGFLLYQAMESGRSLGPLDRLFDRDNRTNAPSADTPASLSPESIATIKQNPYLKPALANKALLELVSVRRIPGTPNEVSVEMRVYRLADNVVGTDTINLGATTAREPITNETYKAVDPLKRSSGTVSLFNLRKGQPVDAYVVLKAPENARLLDIFVENAEAFKNMPVADAEPIPDGINGTSIAPSSPTPPLGTVTVPGTLPNPAIAPSNATPNIQQPVPVPGTIPPAPPSPSTPVPTPQSSSQSQPTVAATNKANNPRQNGDDNKLVRKAYGNKAEVELISADRVLNPQTGKRDLVNVQMRIRRLSDLVEQNNTIPVGRAIGINPVSSQTYNASNVLGNSTESIPLYTIPKGESVNGYVSLRVPSGVQILDIQVPEVGTFNQVQISN